MGRVIVSLPDELELQLRDKAIKRFGFKRGYLKKALLEAVELWVKGELPEEGDDDGSN